MEVDGRISLDGEKIKQLRLKHCLSREMFSKATQDNHCYISVSTIKRAEAGNKIYYRTAQDIAKTLKVHLDELKYSELKVVVPSIEKSVKSRALLLKKALLDIESISILKLSKTLLIQGEPGIGKSHFIDEIILNSAKLNYVNIKLPIYNSFTYRMTIIRDILRNLILIKYPEIDFSFRSLNSFSATENLQKDLTETLISYFIPTQKLNYLDYKEFEIPLIYHLIKQIRCHVLIVFEDIQWSPHYLTQILNELNNKCKDISLALILSSSLSNKENYEINFSNVEVLNLPKLHENELIKVVDQKNDIPKLTFEKIIKKADGNPLFLKQLISHYANDNNETLPQSLNSLIKEQLIHLSQDNIYFLKVLSTLEHAIEFKELEVITNVVDFSVDELIKYNLIHKVNENTVEFNHRLIKDSVYENLDESEKIEIHLKIAEYYKDKDVIQYTYHLSKSNELNKAQSKLQDTAQQLFEKNNYSESLNHVNFALTLPGNKNFYKLYFLKGCLLKLLDLPFKAIIYFNKALNSAKTENERAWVFVEKTEIYAVNKRYELSMQFLKKTKVILNEINDKALCDSVHKFERFLEYSNSLNSLPRKISYSESNCVKTSLENGKVYENIHVKKSFNKEHTLALLCSLSGDMKTNGEGILKTSSLAIDEINETGGLLGQKLKYEIFDGKSDENEFKIQAQKIINSKSVKTIIGCSTSTIRKSVQSTIENTDTMLIYPFHYEGLEYSHNTIYTGMTSSTQSVPIVDWLYNNLNSRSFFYVGSDYIYPHLTKKVINDYVNESGGKIVGDFFAPVASKDFNKAINEIKKLQPDTVIITLATKASNKAFLKLFHEAGLKSSNINLISLNLSDREIQNIPKEYTIGLYSASTYFEGIDSYPNNKFIKKFRKKFGNEESIGSFMESTYSAIMLYAKAVNICKSFDIEKILEAISGTSYFGPGGLAYIDENSHNVWRQIHIAQVGLNSKFKLLWSSQQPMSPKYLKNAHLMRYKEKLANK